MSESATPLQLYKAEAFFDKLIKIILIILLSEMSVVIVYQVFSRYVLNQPSSISDELLRFSLIWLGLLGTASCFFQDKHLNLPIFLDKLSENKLLYTTIFIRLVNIIFGLFLAVGGYFAFGKNYDSTTPILKLSVGLMQISVLICGVLMVLNQALGLFRIVKGDLSKVLKSLFVVVFLILLSIAFNYFKGLESFENYLYDHLELLSFLVLFISFFILLILGVPIAVGLAISGIFTLWLQIDFSDLVTTSGEKIFSGLDSFGFLALPFFILAGNIMNQGGIAERLITLAMLLAKRVPGSLWQTNIVANMLFGSLSGSAIAASTAIGGIISPMAKEKKYDMPMTTAINAASSICGMLIPPTGVFIVYSMITGGSASIGALFLAGYIPGIIMGLCVMIVAFIYAKKRNYYTSNSSITSNMYLNVIWRALPSLFLIVVVIGGIVQGVFTAIEASGIAVVYSLFLSICYRTITFKSLIKIIYDSALSSSVILFLIACSGLMSWSMTFASIPDTVGNFLTYVSDNKYIILLLINITLLIVGVFMDMTPALLIFTPILYPVVTQLGVDPVHFGVILVYNLSMGIVTPPVGTVLFVSCSISGEKITNVIKPLLPIFLVQFIGLLLVTYWPAISLWLPKALGLM